MGCENIEDRGKLFGNYGASPLLPCEQSFLPLVLRGLVLRLQLGESLNHPVDEGPVFALLHSVGLLPIPSDRHQSWDCTGQRSWA